MIVPAMPSPPGPRARFPGAHLLAFYRDMLGFLCRLRREYGDVVAFRLGPERTVLLSHPEHIHEVLVRQHRAFMKGRRGDVSKQFLGEGLLNSEGAMHQRQRHLMQPAFHRQRLTQYATVMTTYGARLSQSWQDGDTLDIAPAMMRVSLAIAAKTLLDADVEEEATDIGRAITTLLRLSPRFSFPFAPLLRKLPLPSHLQLRRAQHYLDTLIYRLIDERRATGGDTGDVLSMLLHAQADDGSPMSTRQIHDEALTLLLAGHETTALALSWTWYLVAQHPDVDAAMQTELQTVLGGRLPTAEDLPQLPYSRMVLSEALRLYPPAWLMTRRALGRGDDWSLSLSARHLLPHQSVYHASRPALFCQSGGVCPCTVGGDRRRCPLTHRLFPVWRWAAPVSWRRVCMDGRSPGARDGGPDMAHAAACPTIP